MSSEDEVELLPNHHQEDMFTVRVSINMMQTVLCHLSREMISSFPGSSQLWVKLEVWLSVLFKAFKVCYSCQRVVSLCQYLYTH